FTGGDPFKREHFIELAKYAYFKGIEVGILGNPIEVSKIRQIEKYVYDYQISLDGTREVHDTIRGSDDAFDRAINTLNEFRNFNSKLRVMSTVSKRNISSVLELFEEISNLEFERFDFARFIPIENVENNREDILNKNEYRKFLYDIFNKNMTSQIEVGTKEPLWSIILENVGLIKTNDNKDKIYGGCSVGLNLLTVLPDGTCYPCRRLPIEIGQLPEESIRDVFIESEKLNELREFESIEKCGQCDLLPYCRGCRAMAYTVNGSYFNEDPNCWR
ncbi:MAG: SPASM domain-containing protein, partial [Candidatus Aenigmatarchaeota archaeon]